MGPKVADMTRQFGGHRRRLRLSATRQAGRHRPPQRHRRRPAADRHGRFPGAAQTRRAPARPGGRGPGTVGQPDYCPPGAGEPGRPGRGGPPPRPGRRNVRGGCSPAGRAGRTHGITGRIPGGEPAGGPEAAVRMRRDALCGTQRTAEQLDAARPADAQHGRGRGLVRVPPGGRAVPPTGGHAPRGWVPPSRRTTRRWRSSTPTSSPTPSSCCTSPTATTSHWWRPCVPAMSRKPWRSHASTWTSCTGRCSWALRTTGPAPLLRHERRRAHRRSSHPDRPPRRGLGAPTPHLAAP